jgi:hypothetical protein
MGSGVLMGEHAAFALPDVLLFVCCSGIAATARLLVRVEDEMQLMEKLFDIHGRALLQAKGEHQIILALLDLHVREAAPLRILLRADESGLRDVDEEALAFDVSAIIIKRCVGDERQAHAVGRLAATQSEDAFLSLLRRNGKLLRNRERLPDTADIDARVRARGREQQQRARQRRTEISQGRGKGVHAA